jgi:hypothetical protein
MALAEKSLYGLAIRQGESTDAKRRRNSGNKTAEFGGWQFPNLDLDGDPLLAPFHMHQSRTLRRFSRKGIELIIWRSDSA